jgi:hypothetical protein
MEQTIESQVEALRQYVNDRGWTLEDRHTPCATSFGGHQACEIKRVASEFQIEKDTNGMS